MITLYLIRHAETVLNANTITIGGQSPKIVLSEKGIEQATALGAKLDALNLPRNNLHIFTSPYIRAKETAQLALKNSSLFIKQTIEDDALIEFSQGEWEGKNRTQVYTAAQCLAIEQKNPWFAAPGGESWMQVQMRVAGWIDLLLQDAQYSDAHVVVFSHGVTIRAFVTYLLGLAPRACNQLDIENASICQFEYGDKGWILRMFGG